MMGKRTVTDFPAVQSSISAMQWQESGLPGQPGSHRFYGMEPTIAARLCLEWTAFSSWSLPVWMAAKSRRAAWHLKCNVRLEATGFKVNSGERT